MDSAAKFLSSVQRLSLGNMVNEVKLRGGNIKYSDVGMPEVVELKFLDGSKFKAFCYFLENTAWFEGFVEGNTSWPKIPLLGFAEPASNGENK